MQSRGEPFPDSSMLAVLAVYPVTQSTLNIIRTLLVHNTQSEVSRAPNQAIVAMCYEGHLNLVQLMLDIGANVNQSCKAWWKRPGNLVRTPFMMAIGNSRKDLISLLLSRGADANQKQNVQGSICGNALSEAARLGSDGLQDMKLLLAHGADVNANAGHYGSPLTAALGFHQINAVRLLILNGADVNMVMESHYP